MRIKLKYPDVETFIQKYAVNISRGGIFIATKHPKPVGTYLRFEFVLSDAGTTSIIRGEGQVQWTKEVDPNNPGKPHGMGVKFTRIDGESQAVIERALKWRAEHGTSPGVPVPVPTSSAHTIDTGSQAGRLPTREPSQAGPLPTRGAPITDESTEVRLPPAEGSQAEPLPEAPPSLPEAPPSLPLPAGGRGETRPIAIEDRDEPVGRAPNEHTRPISLRDPGRRRPGDEIDSLVAEWGLSEEKLARILKRARPRMVEATAELERLLLKPPKLPTPTKAEALAQLGPLLAKKNGRNGTPTHD